MNYLTPEQAQHLPGLRLALTAGVPAPYSMSAKAIFDLKDVPFTPVLQQGGGANDALIAWTGHRNAPLAMYDDEAPRAGWLDILNLAERLGHGPSLLPSDIGERMTMVALTNELIGEGGFIWQMRLVLLGLGGPERSAEAATANPMYAQYGYSEEAKAQALNKAREILDVFTEHTLQQRQTGSNYLIGDQLSALDIFWVYFSQLVNTLPEEVCPTPRGLRKSYDLGGEAIGSCEPVLIEQRDWILSQHLTTPMVF